MIGNSCRVFVTDLKNQGLITQEKYNDCMETIEDSRFHVENRNQIMMILLPRKLNVDDSSQAAFLRAAVSRVSF